MPFGIDDPVIGYATFAVIKLGGYNLAAFYLKYRYPKSTIHPVFSGLTRTVLGMVFGALLLLVINSINLAALSIFYLLLVPV
ncbi:MAG: hypothetical protein JNN15_05865, partial [Blastocatellia bacterium]|nr:hypothetical protein [Blastocatellia bacterium]